MSILVYVVLCIIWGSTWVAIKIGLSSAPPLHAAALRFAVAIVILAVITIIRRERYPKRFRDLLRLGYPGLYMYGASYACVYFGETYIDSSLAAILFGSFPFFVAFLAAMGSKAEMTSVREWLGLIFGFMGVVVISYNSLQISGDIFLGTLLVVIASFCAAYGLILHKRHHSKESIYVSAIVQMALGGLAIAVAAVCFENWSDSILSARSVESILYLALFGTVIAFLGYYWLLTHSRAVTVSYIAFVTPLVAILIGVLFYGETLTPLIIAGAVMILIGILLVVRRQ